MEKRVVRSLALIVVTNFPRASEFNSLWEKTPRGEEVEVRRRSLELQEVTAKCEDEIPVSDPCLRGHLRTTSYSCKRCLCPKPKPRHL